MKIKILYSWEMYFQLKHARTPIKGVFIPRKDLPLVLIQQGGVVLKPTVKGVNDMVEPVNPMPDGTCRTIKNQYYKTSQANFERSTTFGATVVQDGLAIRKLTPKECFRLMGFDDSDVDLLMQNGISNTQLYKMAGNSIVVNVLEFIFCQIFDDSNKIWV